MASIVNIIKYLLVLINDERLRICRRYCDMSQLSHAMLDLKLIRHG